MTFKFIFSFSLILVLNCSQLFAQTLIEKKFAAAHPEWKIGSDTSSSEILIGYKDIEIPVKVSWVIATDTSGCLRIAYFKIFRQKEDSGIKFYNLSITTLPCAMKWESDDKRRFETLHFRGEYSARKGIKQYSYKGLLGTVRGNGEFTTVPLE